MVHIAAGLSLEHSRVILNLLLGVRVSTFITSSAHELGVVSLAVKPLLFTKLVAVFKHVVLPSLIAKVRI